MRLCLWLYSDYIHLMIEIVPAYDRLDDIRMLLSEYTEMLLSINYEFRLYLELQRYDDEALNPSEKYAMPYGRLYLALYDGRPAGCIALHRLEGTACEMKRLFVRPEYRGHHIATMLVDRILEDACAIGYDEMYLDTLPELSDAVSLYHTFGFTETSSYNDSPVERTIFMKKTIQPKSSMACEAKRLP